MAQHINNTIFILPDAPYECDAGFGKQWFELSDSITYQELRAGLNIAAPALFNNVILKASDEYKISLDNINLIGFSQGAILALEMIYYANFSHIISYSGLFAFGSQRKTPYTDTKVLLVHGDDDMVVPYTNLKMSSESLGMIGIQPTTLTCHNIGHSISQEGFAKGISFILDQIDSKILL